jgi:hypothetical protein
MASPNKYRRIAPSAESLDDYRDQTLFSQEKFTQWDYTKAGAPQEVYSLAEGGTVLHKFQLPATARQHFFWIASGAYFHESSADFWFVQGCLNFYRAGRPVGCFIFGDCDQASAATATQVAAATRQLIRTAPDGTGSPQTTLRFQKIYAGGVRNNLDISCFVVPVVADSVDWQLNSSRVEFNSGPGVRIFILTGCRIISTP